MTTSEIIPIIPQPVKITQKSGKFFLTEEIEIAADTELIKINEYLKKLLISSTGFDVKIVNSDQKENSKNTITLKIDKTRKRIVTGGYLLQISEKQALISAPTTAGIFYGVQSLRQLLPVEIESVKKISNVEWTIPCVEIEDYPRFSWRGYMLDEGRHFLGKNIVKKMLDLMALLKMNVFHWHLTDDQGWRIEIKKHPRLTEIGSKRKETQIGGFLSKKTDGIPHGGYYTQDDIKEIITHAKERFIKVVPEIDAPGHSKAALVAYPELSCTGGPFEVPTRFGIKKDVYCIGKEKVFEFLQDVFNEIITLFPSDIIHIGGDEVPKARWKECLDCQARIKEEKLKNEKDLQVYFTNRIASYLSSHGRRTMGWNQILNDGLPKDVIGQYWMLGKKQVLKHLRQGRNMVMSKFGGVYLDYDYPRTPLKKVYKYDPVPKKLEKKYHVNILGIEAPLWTEWVRNIGELEWQTFPRLVAVAENGWTLKNEKNYRAFKNRLEILLKRLDLLEVNYADKEIIDPGFFKRLFGFYTMFKEPNRKK